MLLADSTVAFALLIIGVLTVLITILACMIKMSRELEDITDAMKSVARSLSLMRNDLNDRDENTSAGIENHRNVFLPKPTGERTRKTRANNVRPPEVDERELDDDQIEVLAEFDDHGNEVDFDELFEQPVGEDEPTTDAAPQFDIVPIDDLPMTDESHDQAPDSPPSPHPLPTPTPVTDFLDRAVPVGNPKMNEEDNIVVDEGDDGEIVYI
jgi:hypothetical protein